MSTFIEYLEKYALVSLEKQEKFRRLIGEHTRELDLDSGLIRFDSDLVFPFQVLGTESNNTLTWLWAWSEEQTEIPPNLIKSSFELKDWGNRHRIREFMMPSVDLNGADGHAISLIATEVCRASCYYRDPYEGGTVYVLIFGKTIDEQPPLDFSRLSPQYT